MATCSDRRSGRQERTAYVRLATRKDVAIANLLIHGLTRDHDMECLMTETALEAELVRYPPLEGLTVFLLELGPSIDADVAGKSPGEAATDRGTCQLGASSQVSLDQVDDVETGSFASAADESRVVVGHMSVFPSYSSRLAMAALRVEDLYIRDAYRRRGLGTILLGKVAEIVRKQGVGRLEWGVHFENTRAIKFYETMGATVLKGKRMAKFPDDMLHTFAKN